MRHTLIVFTERYPNEFIGGVYEEKEIISFHKHFKIVFAINGILSESANPNFIIPENVSSFTYISPRNIWSKIWAVRLLFSKICLEEIRFIRNELKIKINIGILKIMVVELNNAIVFKNFIRELLKKTNSDLSSTVIYSFWNDYRAIAAALLKRDYPQIKAISRTHGGDVYFERHPYNYLPFKKFIFNNLDGIFPISDCSREYLVKKINHKKNNVISFKLGVSNKFALKEYNFQRTLRIASCSHIVKIKRVDLIAKALNKITAFPFIWSHIGADYLNNEVNNFCKKNFDASNQKNILLGIMDNNSIMEYYNSNQQDVFINTSSSEGIAISIMEAMSFGIPVIATAVGGTPEIVKDGYNGFLLPENPTQEEVAETITQFYNLSYEEKCRMRQNAYNTWKEEYNADNNYHNFVENILSFLKS